MSVADVAQSSLKSRYFLFWGNIELSKDCFDRCVGNRRLYVRYQNTLSYAVQSSDFQRNVVDSEPFVSVY